MATYSVIFDIKCLGLSADQDAGVITKGEKAASFAFLSDTYAQMTLPTSYITTFGNRAFKTGECCGFLRINFGGYYLYVFPTLFDEVKASGNAFFRFHYSKYEWWPSVQPF